VISLLFPGCELIGLGGGPSGPRLTEIPGKIVYAKDVDGSSQIFVTDQVGTRQLTSADTPYEYAVTPSFSPDGEHIVYGRGDGTGREELYVMNADGSEKRPLIRELPNRRRVFGTDPAWAPSGDRIAYQACPVCNLGGRGNQIFVANLESETVDTLTSLPGSSSFPTWSPDGEQIAFTSDRAYVDSEENRGDTDLYIMNADGSNVRRLTNSGRTGIPLWDGSGDKIAYAYQKVSAQLFFFDLAKDKSTEIETDLTGRIKLFPSAWSPDQSRLLLTAGNHPDLHPYILDLKNGQTQEVPVKAGGPVRVAGDWHVD
jgi:TolB protein